MDTRLNINERNFRSTLCGFARRNRRSPLQSVDRIAGVFAMFALCAAGFASASQQPQKSADRRDSSRGEFSGPFEVPHRDLANAEALANQLAALSPRVGRNEAKLLADCAYATVSQLRREYRMFGTPIFNNFLVYHGIKKRGYCYQWSEDLLVALDKLKVASLELHWGEAHAGSWRENNCLVVTAKGQPFRTGIMLDCWRHLGHLYFCRVVAAATNNFDPYVENSTYACFVLAKSARSNVSGPHHHVAFQRITKAGGKTDDQ